MHETSQGAICYEGTNSVMALFKTLMITMLLFSRQISQLDNEI